MALKNLRQIYAFPGQILSFAGQILNIEKRCSCRVDFQLQFVFQIKDKKGPTLVK